MGKMKDETSSVPIYEFVGLKSKMYSISYGTTDKKRAKGINKSTVREITHKDYYSILHSNSCTKHDMRRITNHLHQMYTVELSKISLSAFDDKRFIQEDGISTLA